MTLKNEIAQEAAKIPAAIALLLAALFVGITLFIAFWKKRKRRKTHKRADKWNWGYALAAFLFIGFGAYFLFLGFDDR